MYKIDTINGILFINILGFNLQEAAAPNAMCKIDRLNSIPVDRRVRHLPRKNRER
jgi:hypothetical protein